jgi:hypothetical protein
MERALDFSRNKTQELSLADLAKTYIENYPNGEPVGGIYHYVLINEMLEKLEAAGLKPEVAQITAADNRDRMRPGVTIFKEMEAKYGEGSFESHALRRVYAIINVKDFADKDTDYNCAISYHQKGISVGFGPQVRVCSNMMIMGARYFLSTTSLGGIMGKRENMKNVNELLTKADELIAGFSTSVVEWRQKLDDLRYVTLEANQCRVIFGRLMEERILYDTQNKDLHTSTIYPLNDTFIKLAYERYLAYLRTSEHKQITAWEFYNLLNEDLKPSRVDMPLLQPQMVRLNDFLFNELGKL